MVNNQFLKRTCEIYSLRDISFTFLYFSLDLKERDWNTLEFYREHQDNLIPAGLAFFQSDWDPTVTEFYHSSLGMYAWCLPICLHLFFFYNQIEITQE